MTSYKRSPDAAATANGALTASETDRQVVRPTSNEIQEPHPLVSQLQSARDRLQQLEQLGRWGIDLRARMWRETRQFELLDCDHDFSALQSEVRDYRRVCRALRWG